MDVKQHEINFRYDEITKDILRTLEKPGLPYWIMIALIMGGLAFGIVAWMYQIKEGMGVAGLNHPVGWGVYITDFVFWVGIGHAGTLISAILFLFRAKWRNAIFRSAEAMTIFAVLTAALFPLIHVGRVWVAWWLIPYPNQRELWVNFRSPLLWDVFAINTYFSVSAIFFCIGLIPDVAAIRDKARGMRKTIYTFMSLGFDNSNHQWRHYMAGYGFFAALATPLVLSVHSVVSWDFAVSIVPGWHSTLFAPYFVAGAVFSGMAMVMTILIPFRSIFKLEKYLTTWHFDMMSRLVMLTGSIVTYSYLTEYFIAWYSDDPFEMFIFYERAFGKYQLPFMLMFGCNCVIPLLLWFRGIRTNLKALWVITIFVNIGMWFERFNIIVSSLAQEFDPYSWGWYVPSWVEMGITLGSFCWFFMWFFLFIKFFPSLALTEMKEIADPPHSGKGHSAHGKEAA
ncbi:Polysulfide reductase NrfD [Sulfidibacter corallicola]|uniref:Polysulfide reductase NrfD n=1 Tax=Sulfidibacter corallicola TaxID=2818388 RepID=A0A8A4TXR0_SULCO|nr:NrfD/PsrC family molybdoenzyme membrane anchor subunit [Sulfidibacter corallicola]QTD53978.1 polysulfide reductase NrfD [Sulfidibacter corallicola]